MFTSDFISKQKEKEEEKKKEMKKRKKKKEKGGGGWGGKKKRNFWQPVHLIKLTSTSKELQQYNRLRTKEINTSVEQWLLLPGADG